MSETSNGLGQSFEKIAFKTGEDIASAVTVATSKTNSYLIATREYIEKNPIQSLIVAAAAGVVIGAILAKRHPRSNNSNNLT